MQVHRSFVTGTERERKELNNCSIFSYGQHLLSCGTAALSVWDATQYSLDGISPATECCLLRQGCIWDGCSTQQNAIQYKVLR
mmetsp:Transcript_23959/g.50950  ORF Transcript_23959/g.50950 Transcript_23959/m.50950 type:complete len:83 (+) Transcript_23959:837-1085(+)